MTSTQFYGAASLDGFIATPDHDLGWLLQFGDIEGSSYPAFIRDVGALAMGSHTYEWMLKHAIDAGLPWPYAQPTWVFSSRTLRGIAGADVRFVRGDVRPVHQAMVQAAAGRNVWIVGGGELAGQFYDAGLLDALIVQIAPVTLGAGTPLLPRRIAQPALRLTSVTTLGGLFAELRYAVPLPESD
ncbi:MAG: dihydrofolate reductase family protein [Acidovorax sp.]|uniref:dihydrofolate reductase family protein n=1 Tax=Acidovorax sp. TaxID=1872122 RepID=UPI0022C9E57E|nr:dihydrofolate reductase family protein [Acidovorax sp.]MCZ8220424.1 dihydrofolate reductase family protein [Acidovorax sp.]